MMLRKASNSHAYAKLGFYGEAGSGKTYTAAKIAIGLHQYAKLKKPIGMFDTEPAASYLIPLFEAAGINFLVYDESRALSDLMDFMDEAEKECSVVIIDSITHVWRDAQESHLKAINERKEKAGKRPIASLEFHHWRIIKSVWGKFTDRFISSKLHCIVCGRAGSIYEYQTGANGRKELITIGTKMATEKELGYEPSLLVEMVKVRDDGLLVNRALVEKDRTAQINGIMFDMPTFENFLPHFQLLNLGGDHFDSMNQRDSSGLYGETAEESGWDREKRDRTIYSEEIKQILMKHIPGQGEKDKVKKADVLEEVFGSRSWTKISEDSHSSRLKWGFEKIEEMFTIVDEKDKNEEGA